MSLMCKNVQFFTRWVKNGCVNARASPG